jgi:hypothetical protein
MSNASGRSKCASPWFADPGDYRGTGRDGLTVQPDLLGRNTEHRLHRRAKAEHLLDRLWEQVRRGLEPIPHGWSLGQAEQRIAQQVGRCLVAAIRSSVQKPSSSGRSGAAPRLSRQQPLIRSPRGVLRRCSMICIKYATISRWAWNDDMTPPRDSSTTASDHALK